jgi:hypothetical protein
MGGEFFNSHFSRQMAEMENVVRNEEEGKMAENSGVLAPIFYISCRVPV